MSSQQVYAIRELKLKGESVNVFSDSSIKLYLPDISNFLVNEKRIMTQEDTSTPITGSVKLLNNGDFGATAFGASDINLVDGVNSNNLIWAGPKNIPLPGFPPGNVLGYDTVTLVGGSSYILTLAYQVKNCKSIRASVSILGLALVEDSRYGSNPDPAFRDQRTSSFTFDIPKSLYPNGTSVFIQMNGVGEAPGGVTVEKILVRIHRMPLFE